MRAVGIGDGKCRREEAAFLVLLAALAGAGIAGLTDRLLPPSGEWSGLSTWGIVWALLTAGLAAAALHGVFRAVRTGSIRNRALFVYVLAGIFVFGVKGWLVQLPFISPSAVFRSSRIAAEAGVNLGGILLFCWYGRLCGSGPAVAEAAWNGARYSRPPS